MSSRPTATPHLGPLASALGAALLVLLLAPAALAGGGGFVMSEHGFYIIDFLAFMGILIYFAKGPAASFLAKRRAEIVEEMARASDLRAEAELRLARYESLLADLEGEIARLQDEFRADGERERERILAAGEEQAERIRHETAATIARETAQLSKDLEHDVAARALELADQLVRERMNAETQRTLVKSFIEELESKNDLRALSA